MSILPDMLLCIIKCTIICYIFTYVYRICLIRSGHTGALQSTHLATRCRCGTMFRETDSLCINIKSKSQDLDFILHMGAMVISLFLSIKKRY